MIGTVAGAVQRTLTAHWRALLPVAAGLGLVSAVVGNILNGVGEDTAAEIEAGRTVDLGEVLSSIFIGTLLVAVITLVLDAILFNMIDEGERTGTADIGYGFRRTFERIGPLAIVVLLSGLAVAIGLIFFILPGIYLLVILLPAVAVLFLEDKGAIESMSRSRELVQPRFFEVFGVLLGVIVISIVVSVVFSLFGFVGDIVTASVTAVVGQAVLYHTYQALVGATPAE